MTTWFKLKAVEEAVVRRAGKGSFLEKISRLPGWRNECPRIPVPVPIPRDCPPGTLGEGE